MANNTLNNSSQDYDQSFRFSQNQLEKSLDTFFSTGTRHNNNKTPPREASYKYDYDEIRRVPRQREMGDRPSSRAGRRQAASKPDRFRQSRRRPRKRKGPSAIRRERYLEAKNKLEEIANNVENGTVQEDDEENRIKYTKILEEIEKEKLEIAQIEEAKKNKKTRDRRTEISTIKPDPEAYWKVWWAKYAYIENIIPIVDKNVPEVKNMVKFSFNKNDQQNQSRMNDILKVGIDRINRNFNITETNYQSRDVYKLFIYKRLMEDINFQKRLNPTDKDRVLKSLTVFKSKRLYSLMLQSLISKWDNCHKTMAGAVKSGNWDVSVKMMNTKLFHYLVMESIKELKTLCALDWSGFNEFYENQMSMPPQHLTNTHGEDGENNSDMDNGDA
ncbi:uncharacterized protein LOC106083687 [Stomoxys calcitrans]|uniref:Uncharacterized protein n=1 Tax=Stomoxys calcitrans TaxID=35570 RepID=A0A1I8NNL0_STOCA|nr:uncharacterized protein LOC106083687 [Stomoxys calcitrans]